MSGSRTLKIEILGDPKSAAKAFDVVGDSAEGFGARLASVGKVVVGATVAIGAAVAGIGVAAYKIGESFDEAYDTIRIGTGATGEALAALEDDFKAVVASVPTDFGTASTAIADLNTRLGLTGEPLQELTTQFINLSRITGVDVATAIASGTRVFGDWSIATEDQSSKLDFLFKVSQSTGIGVDSLMSKVVQFGAPLRGMGFNFEQSAVLMGKWEKEGVNAELVAGSLRIALGKMASEGIQDTNAALIELQQRIQDAGSTGEATAIAMEWFGSRAGPDMATAIREGRFEIDDMVRMLAESGETINGVASETDDLAQSWQLLKNRVMVAVEPVATNVFNLAGAFLDHLLPGVDRVANALSGPLSTAVGLAHDGFVTMAQALRGDWTDDDEIHPLHRAIGLIGSTIHDTVLPALSDFVGFIQDDVLPAIGGLIDAFQEDGLSGLLTEVGGILASLGSDLASWATDQIGEVDWVAIGADVRDRVLSGLQRAAGSAADAGVWLKDQITGVDWGDVGSSILDGILAGWDAVTDWGGRAYSWITEQFDGLDWSGLGGAILDGILAGWETVSDWGSRAYGWISGQFTSIDWGGLGSAILDGILAGWETIEGWGQSAYSWISTQFSSVDWSGLGESIQGGISSAISQSQEIAASIESQLRAYDWQTLGQEIAAQLQMGIDTIGLDINLSEIGAQIEDLMPILEPFVRIVEDNLAGSLENVRRSIDGMVPLWTELKELWIELEPLLGPIVDHFADLAKTALIGQMAALAGSIGLVILGLTELAEFLTGRFASMTERAADEVRTFREGIEGIKESWQSVVDFVSELIDGGWSGAWERAKGFVSDTADAILGFLAGLATDGIAKVQELISGIDDKLISLFVNGPKRIWDFVQAGLTELGKLVTDGAAKAGELPGAVTDAIGDLGSLLIESGRDVVRGFISGLTDVDLLGSVKSAASGIANSAKNAVTGALGIQSPSRVMHQYGLDVGQGFADGMSESEPIVDEEARKLAEAAAKGVMQTLSDMESIVSGEAGKKLSEELADLLSMRQVAEQMGDSVLVDLISEQITGKLSELHDLGQIMATPIVQGMIAEFAEGQAMEQLADEWEQRLADAIAGPRVGERLQSQIDDLTDKIDLGRLLGAPEEVIAAWEAERDELADRGAQYWQDVALAASQGLIDQETIQAYAKAGGEQFAAYLDALVGPEQAKQLVGGAEKMSKAAVDAMANMMWDSPSSPASLAKKITDDLVNGLLAGRLDLQDASRILMAVPVEEMADIFDKMRDGYLEKLTAAVLAGNDAMAESIREQLALLRELQDAHRAVRTETGHEQRWQASQQASGGSSGTATSSGVYIPPPPSRATGGVAFGPTLVHVAEDSRPELIQPLAAGHPERDRLIRDVAAAAQSGRSAEPGQIDGDYVLENQIVVKLESDEVLARGVNRVNLRNLITEMGPV